MEQNIIDSKKLIAEFMGLKNVGMKNLELWLLFDKHTGIETSELKYCISWDWLMPVIKKILDIASDQDFMEQYYQIVDCIPVIEETWEEVVEFIKWYNERRSE
jgi:hypothetical protein